MREGLIETDEHGLVVGMNERAEELTGWPRIRALGQAHDRVLRLVAPTEGASRNPLRLCLQGGAARISSEHQSLSRDGRRLNLRCSAGALLRSDGGISGAVVVFEDCTRMNLLSEELAYRSAHDPVTGLLNRDEFERRVTRALARSRSGGAEHLLGYLDLDQFKVVNDVHGHFAGDEMLRQIASVFRAALRPDVALARLGGDEFGVLLEDTGLEGGMPQLEGLLEAARLNRFVWEGQSFSTTASMGVVTINARTPDTSRVLSLADAACFAAKEDGRNRVHLAEDDDATARRYSQMSMVARINRALDENQFSLYYEDVVCADAPGKVVYRELLLRIRSDSGEMQPPAEFIAAAERYYMMSALDRWVVNAALDGIAFRNDGVIYAINISGLSLGDRRFHDYVVERIRDSGVEPSQLCFEITETAAITHLSEARAFIERLAETGCRFALDDFGSGMASFSYLRNLPVHFVKIDGSFVRSMLANPLDRGMVEAINRIGHDMGLKTIAEHVEDEGLVEALRGIGVDWIQGHAISKARPFDELIAS
jgi:diguanylate cyclase (GGDEF)-like protein/PAS domain S-box-containing protein